tara:strand:- start:8694 stop:9710 length:1017 start_codon:yes stop_codon:yes gene_type:complete
MNTEEPLVSIIIPTFNRAHLIGETLDSVLAQTYQNWECIIVDDGSTDNTAEVVGNYLETDARFQYHHRPQDRPKGANACRNFGFEISNGEYVLFLDSDDLLVETCINKRINIFLESPNLDFIISDTGQFKDGKFSNQSINKDPLIKNCKEYALLFFNYTIPWPIMSVFWRKSILKDYRFDESLHRLQDVDFHIQILSFNEFNFKRVYEIDSYYRYSADEKKEGNEYDIKLIKSFLLFIDKNANILKEDKEIRIAFKRFLYVISRDFIFYNPYSNQESVRTFFEKISKNNLLDFKDILLFRIMHIYKITNLYNKKGFGVLRFRKYANDYFNRSYNLKNG